MQKKLLYPFLILAVPFSGWCAVAWSGWDLYPIQITQNQTTLETPSQEIFSPGENYSAPRNQVLLEIVTGTW